MLTSTIKRNAFRVLATLAFAAAPAFGSLIPITNFNFETVPVGGFPIICSGPCSYSLAAIPGWVGTAVIRGEAQYGIGTRFSSYTDPPTIAFSNDGIISQTVSATVGIGTVYTLMVDIGQRADSGSFGGTADLLIGATALNGGAHFITAIGSAPASGGWSTFSSTYTGLANDLGASMTIELRSAGIDANQTQHQGNFDNVSLSTGVPEPASFLLIGSALLALKAFRRRRPIA